MSSKFDLQQIRDFWTEQAASHGESHSASWSDRPAIELEIQTQLRHITDGDSLLDIGCANGWSTIRFAAKRRIKARGLDYIPEMIDFARSRLEKVRRELVSDVEFDTGDITQLDEPDGTYDKVVVTRVIINLSEWGLQQAGLRHAARVVKPGGLLLLSEATIQGWQRLNKLRNEWDLPDIPMPSFNKFLDEHAVVDELSTDMELVELVNFASTYSVGTRVFKPLLINALRSSQDVANPDMELNRFFSQMPAAGDYGTQKLFIFRKR